MTSEEAIALFRKSGALLDGHFILRSGRHSRQFFQCALALQEMPVVEKFGAALAQKVQATQPRTIVAPAMGGLVIGQEVARQLGCRFIFAEKDEGRLVIRRGFTLSPGERCLIVEDVVTQGGRARETLDIVRNLGGLPVGVGVLVDRSDATPEFGVPMFSLIRLHVETFDPLTLPPDLRAIPAVKPGSK